VLGIALIGISAVFFLRKSRRLAAAEVQQPAQRSHELLVVSPSPRR
jgi:hypothetical protein